MTTTELLDRVQNYKIFKQDKVSFNPEEVYTPANDAQNLIQTTLRMVEGKCDLRLVSGQERYQFTDKTVTAATNATPIVITTSAAHLYNTGDTVIVNGALGNTAANGRFTITKVDSTSFSLDDSVGNGAWTSAGTTYHAMQSAFEMKRARKKGDYYGILEKKDIDIIENDRSTFGDTSAPSDVQRYYESFEEDYLFGVQGIPNAAFTLELFYYRLPLSFERIAASINPILPVLCDRLLYYGTLKNLLEDMDEEGKQQIISRYVAEADASFNKELMRIASVNAEIKRPKPKGRARLRW